MSMARSLRVAAAAAAVVGLLPVGAVVAATGALAAEQDGVWVNGVVHALIVTGPGSGKARPLYVIAPVSTAHALHPLADAKTHGFGAHDHVIQLADPRATFHGTCDLTLVVPGPKAKLGTNVRGRMTLTPAGTRPLLYAVRIGKGFVPLNRATRIEEARRAGLASAIDTHTLLACTIKPITR